MIRHHVRSFGNNKIMAIKLVRELSSCGLKEAKDTVEQQTSFVVNASAQVVVGAIKEAALYGIEFDPPLDGSGVSTSSSSSSSSSTSGEGGSGYSVRFVSGPELIPAIKLVRELTGLGLKEAKDLVEQRGIMRTDISRFEADELVRRFAEIHARAEVIEPRSSTSRGGHLHDYLKEDDYDF
jgi:large subunit ribosomal protein L7/L12